MRPFIPHGCKVTVYNSKNPGPLGKPTGIKLPAKPKLTWDPTDTNKKNTKYKLPKPVIKIASTKKTVVKPGSSYKLKAGVTAVDPNTFQDLTSRITVYKVRWYDERAKEYVKKSFSTKRRGFYKITYKVYYKYAGTTYKTLKIRVSDTLQAPVVTSGNAEDTGLVTLHWNAVPGAAKYKIYRATSREGAYKRMYTTSKTSYKNTYQVVTGTTYYYKVKAVSDSYHYIDSKYSNVVSGTAFEPTPADDEVFEPKEDVYTPIE